MLGFFPGPGSCLVDPLHAIMIAAVAASLAALSTPLVIRFAHWVGAVDRPNERKVSTRDAMPLLGGLAVALGCTAGLTVASQIVEAPGLSRALMGFGAGALVLVLAGLWDDRFEMRPVVKLIFQILAAAIIVEAGYRIDLFSNPVTGEMIIVPLWIMWPVSIIWIVGVTNAMNLIDGLDGLSSGVGAIIAGTLTVLCWQGGQWGGVAIGLALFGALIGYLPYNFPPARIFLGDTGSLLIGLGLSVLALEGYRKTALLAFIVPLLALAVPLLDTVLSILRRLRSGKGVFSADRLHMHHRLLQREGSHRSAVLLLYFLTTCFCMIALSFSQIEGWISLIYLAAVIAVTYRLLRNIDAFSLSVYADPVSTDEESTEEGASTRGDSPPLF